MLELEALEQVAWLLAVISWVFGLAMIVVAWKVFWPWVKEIVEKIEKDKG